MGSLRLEGEPVIEVELRRSKAARRLSLRVSRLDGQVKMSLPRWTPRHEALEFAREKETWIRRQLAGQVATITPALGVEVPFEGTLCTIQAAQKGPMRLEAGVFLASGPAPRIPARLAAFLKLAARDRLSVACDAYAQKLGVEYGKITLRDTRSRWGSCTSDGNLMFSWRLIMAPAVVLDYVAAHEVAHLLEMNHSQAYWDHVARICPGYQEPRKWLRQNAGHLHAYQFRN